MSYKVEELLALRDSISESAVSIEKFADEDVIKEHVLRPSKSASAHLTGRQSHNGPAPAVIPVVSTIAVAEAGLHKRPSPSPSIKRGKAEKLLKEHGSPPGIRVTAGGRIVPSDLPPLSTSRFGDISYRNQSSRMASGTPLPLQNHLNINGTARVEVVGGQPVIFVGDRMFALPTLQTVTPTLPSEVTSASPPLEMVQNVDPMALKAHQFLSEPSLVLPRSRSQTSLAGLDLPTLRSQQALKKQELRTVEQTEVLQASHQSDGWRLSMIEKKRSLIVELDALRKQITALESENIRSVEPSLVHSHSGATSSSMPVTSAISSFQPPIPQNMYTYPLPNPYAPMVMYPFASYPAQDQLSFANAPISAPHSPGSGSRRSHAVEIKAPQAETRKQFMSALDPKSPTYQPVQKSDVNRVAAPPTPSLAKQASWSQQNNTAPKQHTRQTLSQKPSLSSIDTTDFFPTNTHEHSSTRMAPGPQQAVQHTDETKLVPSTPEKHWPASPWNEHRSGQSRSHETTSTLTSWPEAFGRQASSSCLRQNATDQNFVALLDRVTSRGPTTHDANSGNFISTDVGSDVRNGIESTWNLAGKPVAHVLSTYQEGYQAGYDHVGVPDSPEVLQGYIQGLLHFLSDESKRRDTAMDVRPQSLRALLAGSTPHDSAVSMTFGQGSVPNINQENIRSTGGQFIADSYVSATCEDRNKSNTGQMRESYGEDLQERSRRKVSSIKSSCTSTHGLLPAKMVSGQYTLYSGAKTSGKEGMAAETIPGRGNSFSTGNVPRSTFGVQLQNRNCDTLFDMQRFFPTSMEASGRGFRGGEATLIRPVNEHRSSGFDGAMDDLAEMIEQAEVEEGRVVKGSSIKGPVSASAEVEESTASCGFRPSSGKAKQQAMSSPARRIDVKRDSMVTPPVNQSESPRKSAEVSPAKAKLEQVTNKFRRTKRDDVRTMSPEDRKTRSDKWRQRFQQLKKVEMDEMEAYAKTNAK